MARPRKLDEQRSRFLPVVTDAFGESGYSKITTRDLAARCETKQAILYRLWPGGKKQMFLAAISHVWEQHRKDWLGTQSRDARSLIDKESQMQGARNHYRIVFQALAEAGDPDVARALSKMYRDYASFMKDAVESNTAKRGKEAELTAWGLLGIGTIARVTLLLGIEEVDRELLLQKTASLLLS